MGVQRSNLDEMVRAFERLVKRVSERRVVPFLGAGISGQARIPGDPSFVPQVWRMQTLLKAELASVLAATQDADLSGALIRTLGGPGPRHWRIDLLEAAESSKSFVYNRDVEAALSCHNCDHLREYLKNTLGKVPEQIRETLDKSEKCKSCKDPPELLPKLDHAADLLTWLKGPAHLCKTLQIEKFAQLSSLSAHRFLAYLAREGLVTEVITTNYDTCIEKAFQATFAVEEAEKNRGRDALAVVFNLTQYREHGGRAFSGRDPVLHLYKINGDAADYAAAVRSNAENPDPDRLELRAARIILTERQLQTFRDELWARDLLADRTRSRSLLFCGFGSDEPQVRHHAMSLMEEMQRQSTPVDDSDKIPNLPNAPFLSAFDPYLSFNQLQIMVGFAMAHTRLGKPADGRSVIKLAYANAMLGQLGQVLRPTEAGPSAKKGGREPTKTSESSNLPADHFFERVFQAVWLEQARRALESGRTFDAWLRSTGEAHRTWAHRLFDWLSSPVHHHAADVDEFEETRRRLFGRASELFRAPEAGVAIATPLMSWLHAVYCGEPLQADRDFYLPLREEPLLILGTLLFVCWLTSPEGADADKQQSEPLQNLVFVEPGLGLGVRVPGLATSGSGQEDRCVYLVREGVRENPNRWATVANGPSLVWVIEIPGNHPAPRGDAPAQLSGSPSTPIRVARRPAARVLRRARSAGVSPQEVLLDVFSNPEVVAT